MTDLTTFLALNSDVFSILMNREETMDFFQAFARWIRVTQKKRRTIILGIHNRAFEKTEDLNLKVYVKNNVEDLDQLISARFEI